MKIVQKISVAIITCVITISPVGLFSTVAGAYETPDVEALVVSCDEMDVNISPHTEETTWCYYSRIRT